MCKPKVPKPKKVEEKPVQYLANPFLDGLAIGAQPGRSALRIDRGSPSVPSPSTSGASGVPPGGIRLGSSQVNPQAAKRSAQGAFAPFLGGFGRTNTNFRLQ